MTGPEHYREAERLIAEARTKFLVHEGEPNWEAGARDLLTTAQIHATLALAAATALQPASDTGRMSDWRAWKQAAETPGGDH